MHSGTQLNAGFAPGRRRPSRTGVIPALVMVLLAASAGAGFAQSAAGDLRGIVDAQYEFLETLYRDLHETPELSFQESETSEKMAAILEREGFEVTRNVGGYGVVGVLNNGEGPTLMIRADMDALPIVEQTGLAYASTVRATNDSGREVGVMHACGHDIHMAVWAGVAKAMTALKAEWRGTLMMIAQPAEERGAGAKAMLADGLFERFPRPDFALALHVDSGLEAGKVGYVPGYSYANVDSVDILIRGRGGHGAYPHLAIDPVVIAAQTVIALQTIVSRELAGNQPAVVTVGSIHGGTQHNIIPDEVTLELTVRTYADETRATVLEAIERIARQTARAARVPDDRLPVVKIKDGYTPALYNDPALVERVVRTFEASLGEDRVVLQKPGMVGEDFGRYGRETPPTPIMMFQLGSVARERIEAGRGPEGSLLPALHSSRYQPDVEPTIRTGVTAMTRAAIDLLGP